MRVLVVTNMQADERAPGRGSFVRDQASALRELGAEVRLLAFPPGSLQYPRAVRAIRAALRSEDFDLVHAHYGLVGWCAVLAGARPLVVTFHGTDVRHPVVGPLSRWLVGRLDLAAGASRSLFGPEGGRPGIPRPPGACAVLPCGAELGRFRPLDRDRARAEVGLDRGGRYLLFPADPRRPAKRVDRARELAEAAGAELLTAGEIDPQRMPLWVNAANAVAVTSDYEGFGLAAVESLACDVPVLSTPVGVAPVLLHGLAGCLAAPFDVARWSEVLGAHLSDPEARTAGRPRAEWFSARRAAERVLVAYRSLLGAASDLS